MPSATQTTSPLKVVEDLYHAFDSQDVAAAFGCFAENVVITQSDDLPWGGTFHGLEEAADFFMTLTSHIQTKVTVDRFIVAGDAVVETGRTEGTAVATGRAFSIAETHVFKVADGKITRMEAYVDNAAMLEAISGPNAT
jgi:ketosteroid isomerase-like protein